MSKRLLVKKQGIEVPELTQEIPENGIITVGNDPTSIIVLADANIAAEQFVIVCEEEKMTLLSRADGNLINDNDLPQGALYLLETGDEITVGEFVIILDSDEVKLPQANKSKSNKSKENKSVKLKNNESLNGDPDEIHQSLSGVLAGLRTEEKFYFEVNNVLDKTETRFYVDAEEMALGWTADGKCLVTSDPEDLVTPQSTIRKDWTGVVISPLRPKSVWVNNLLVTDSHRLKNDDKVTIAEKDSKKQSAQNIIKFHEPTALLVLDSILPKELPPPVSLDEQRKSGKSDILNEAENGKGIHTSQPPQKTKKPKKRKLFFGFFTLTEIIIMIIGTLITAVIIFLILELY
jgi:hypothetical protein